MRRSALLGSSLLAMLAAAPGCAVGDTSVGDKGTWIDVVPVCSYAAVYEANKLAGKTGDPFEITEECASELGGMLLFQGFEAANPEHQAVKRNYLRGLHTMLFQPAVRPQDDTLLTLSVPDEMFPAGSMALLAKAPNTVAQIPADYYNTALFDRFTQNIKTVTFMPEGDGRTMHCCGVDKHTMSVNRARLSIAGNDVKHWTAYVIYHEMQHLNGWSHDPCVGGVGDCDDETNSAYGNQGAFLFALGVGGRSYLTPDGDPLMPTTAAESGQPLRGASAPYALPSTQHLFVHSCTSLLLRVNPLRAVYYADMKPLCSGDAIDAMVRLGYISPTDPLACPGLTGPARLCCLNANDGYCDRTPTAGFLGAVCTATEDTNDCTASGGAYGSGGITTSPSSGGTTATSGGSTTTTSGGTTSDPEACLFSDDGPPEPGVVRLGDSFVVSANRLTLELGRLDALLNEARAEPVTLADGAIGYKLVMLKPGGTFAQLGLQLGDVLVRVNGQPVSPELAMRLALNLSSAGQASIDLVRGYDARSLSYAVAP